MTDFNKTVVRIGTITVALAIIANFFPSLYLWFFHGAVPSFGEIMTIWGLVAAAFAVSWIVQPLSYYGALGMVGSYIAWVVGSAADVRVPAITMAQDVSKTEANTPEGDAIGAMALASTVFVSFSIVTLFVIIGTTVIPLLPPVITDAFKYMLVSLFAAVFVNMAVKNLRPGIVTLILAFLSVFLLPKMGVPGAVVTLVVVILGMVVAGVDFKMTKKPSTADKK